MKNQSQPHKINAYIDAEIATWSLEAIEQLGSDLQQKTRMLLQQLNYRNIIRVCMIILRKMLLTESKATYPCKARKLFFTPNKARNQRISLPAGVEITRMDLLSDTFQGCNFDSVFVLFY